MSDHRSIFTSKTSSMSPRHCQQLSWGQSRLSRNPSSIPAPFGDGRILSAILEVHSDLQITARAPSNTGHLRARNASLLESTVIPGAIVCPFEDHVVSGSIVHTNAHPTTGSIEVAHGDGAARGRFRRDGEAASVPAAVPSLLEKRLIGPLVVGPEFGSQLDFLISMQLQLT